MTWRSLLIQNGGKLSFATPAIADSTKRRIPHRTIEDIAVIIIENLRKP